jgi:hypothetical protein
MENTEKPEQIELELNLEPLASEQKEDDIIVKEAEEPEIQTKQPELTVDDGINELKARLEEERRAREDAERRAKEAYEREVAAKSETNDTNLRLIDNAIETVKRNSEILKQNLKDAAAAGDYDAMANIQADMIKADNDLRQLQTGKKQYEEQIKRPQTTADPIETLASQATPESAKWLRDHKSTLSTPGKLDRALRAHQDAMDDGIKPDSREYFEYIENRMGIRKSEPPKQEESALSEASAPTQRRSAPPAAPVSRSGTGTGGTRSNVVSLNSAEREHARAMGMTDREYAIQKQALIKEGKLAG